MKSCTFLSEDFKNQINFKKKQFSSTHSFMPGHPDFTLRKLPGGKFTGVESGPGEHEGSEVTARKLEEDLLSLFFTISINQFKNLILPARNEFKDSFTMTEGALLTYVDNRNHSLIDPHYGYIPRDDVGLIYILPVIEVLHLLYSGREGLSLGSVASIISPAGGSLGVLPHSVVRGIIPGSPLAMGTSMTFIRASVMTAEVLRRRMKDGAPMIGALPSDPVGVSHPPISRIHQKFPGNPQRTKIRLPFTAKGGYANNSRKTKGRSKRHFEGSSEPVPVSTRQRHVPMHPRRGADSSAPQMRINNIDPLISNPTNQSKGGLHYDRLPVRATQHHTSQTQAQARISLGKPYSSAYTGQIAMEYSTNVSGVRTSTKDRKNQPLTRDEKNSYYEAQQKAKADSNKTEKLRFPTKFSNRPNELKISQRISYSKAIPVILKQQSPRPSEPTSRSMRPATTKIIISVGISKNTKDPTEVGKVINAGAKGEGVNSSSPQLSMTQENQVSGLQKELVDQIEPLELLHQDFKTLGIVKTKEVRTAKEVYLTESETLSTNPISQPNSLSLKDVEDIDTKLNKGPTEVGKAIKAEAKGKPLEPTSSKYAYVQENYGPQLILIEEINESHEILKGKNTNTNLPPLLRRAQMHTTYNAPLIKEILPVEEYIDPFEHKDTVSKPQDYQTFMLEHLWQRNQGFLLESKNGDNVIATIRVNHNDPESSKVISFIPWSFLNVLGTASLKAENNADKNADVTHFQEDNLPENENKEVKSSGNINMNDPFVRRVVSSCINHLSKRFSSSLMPSFAKPPTPIDDVPELIDKENMVSQPQGHNVNNTSINNHNDLDQNRLSKTTSFIEQSDDEGGQPNSESDADSEKEADDEEIEKLKAMLTKLNGENVYDEVFSDLLEDLKPTLLGSDLSPCSAKSKEDSSVSKDLDVKLDIIIKEVGLLFDKIKEMPYKGFIGSPTPSIKEIANTDNELNNLLKDCSTKLEASGMKAGFHFRMRMRMKEALTAQKDGNVQLDNTIALPGQIFFDDDKDPYSPDIPYFIYDFNKFPYILGSKMTGNVDHPQFGCIKVEFLTLEDKGAVSALIEHVPQQIATGVGIFPAMSYINMPATSTRLSTNIPKHLDIVETTHGASVKQVPQQTAIGTHVSSSMVLVSPSTDKIGVQTNIPEHLDIVKTTYRASVRQVPQQVKVNVSSDKEIASTSGNGTKATNVPSSLQALIEAGKAVQDAIAKLKQASPPPGSARTAMNAVCTLKRIAKVEEEHKRESIAEIDKIIMYTDEVIKGLAEKNKPAADRLSRIIDNNLASALKRAPYNTSVAPTLHKAIAAGQRPYIHEVINSFEIMGSTNNKVKETPDIQPPPKAEAYTQSLRTEDVASFANSKDCLSPQPLLQTEHPTGFNKLLRIMPKFSVAQHIENESSAKEGAEELARLPKEDEREHLEEEEKKAVDERRRKEEAAHFEKEHLEEEKRKTERLAANAEKRRKQQEEVQRIEVENWEKEKERRKKERENKRTTEKDRQQAEKERKEAEAQAKKLAEKAAAEKRRFEAKRRFEILEAEIEDLKKRQSEINAELSKAEIREVENKNVSPLLTENYVLYSRSYPERPDMHSILSETYNVEETKKQSEDEKKRLEKVQEQERLCKVREEERAKNRLKQKSIYEEEKAAYEKEIKRIEEEGRKIEEHRLAREKAAKEAATEQEKRKRIEEEKTQETWRKKFERQQERLERERKLMEETRHIKAEKEEREYLKAEKRRKEEEQNAHKKTEEERERIEAERFERQRKRLQAKRLEREHLVKEEEEKRKRLEEEDRLAVETRKKIEEEEVKLSGSFHLIDRATNQIHDKEDTSGIIKNADLPDSQEQSVSLVLQQEELKFENMEEEFQFRAWCQFEGLNPNNASLDIFRALPKFENIDFRRSINEGILILNDIPKEQKKLNLLPHKTLYFYKSFIERQIEETYKQINMLLSQIKKEQDFSKTNDKYVEKADNEEKELKFLEKKARLIQNEKKTLSEKEAALQETKLSIELELADIYNKLKEEYIKFSIKSIKSKFEDLIKTQLDKMAVSFQIFSLSIPSLQDIEYIIEEEIKKIIHTPHIPSIEDIEHILIKATKVLEKECIYIIEKFSSSFVAQEKEILQNLEQQKAKLELSLVSIDQLLTENEKELCDATREILKDLTYKHQELLENESEKKQQNFKENKREIDELESEGKIINDIEIQIENFFKLASNEAKLGGIDIPCWEIKKFLLATQPEKERTFYFLARHLKKRIDLVEAISDDKIKTPFRTYVELVKQKEEKQVELDRLTKELVKAEHILEEKNAKITKLTRETSETISKIDIAGIHIKDLLNNYTKKYSEFFEISKYLHPSITIDILDLQNFEKLCSNNKSYNAPLQQLKENFRELKEIKDTFFKVEEKRKKQIHAIEQQRSKLRQIEVEHKEFLDEHVSQQTAFIRDSGNLIVLEQNNRSINFLNLLKEIKTAKEDLIIKLDKYKQEAFNALGNYITNNSSGELEVTIEDVTNVKEVLRQIYNFFNNSNEENLKKFASQYRPLIIDLEQNEQSIYKKKTSSVELFKDGLNEQYLPVKARRSHQSIGRADRNRVSLPISISTKGIASSTKLNPQKRPPLLPREFDSDKQ